MRHRDILLSVAVILILACLIPLLAGCHGSSGALAVLFSGNEIVGVWWYSGGLNPDGEEYALADLPYLQYFKFTFRGDGTYTAAFKYCDSDETTDEGTWEFDAATQQFRSTSGMFGEQVLFLRNNRLEAKDFTREWTLYYVTTETTNPCDRAGPGRDAIFGGWWYSGGMDPDGNEYTLADLLPLEYVHLLFNGDGTYDAFSKYCGQNEHQAGGTWSFDPLIGTWVIESGFLGQGDISIKNGRLEARDWTGEWTLYHVRPETRNTCD